MTSTGPYGNAEGPPTDSAAQSDSAAAVLSLDGRVRALNERMAAALGVRVHESEGRLFGDLMASDFQRTTAEFLVHAARESSDPSTMRVLEFPGAHGTPLACLVEATRITPPGQEAFVQVREVDLHGRLGMMLVAFRLVAKLADVALWVYADKERRLEWLGGSFTLTALAPAAEFSLKEILRRIHPEDIAAVRAVIRSSEGQSDWTPFRFLTDRDAWHQLAVQTHRARLGLDGPERLVGVVRDDTERIARQKSLMDQLRIERERGEQIAEISSALIGATTEGELRQVVLDRVAAAFGGTGTLLAFTDHDRLRVSSGPGIDPRLAAAMDGMPLNAERPLTYAIRTGEPQFIADRAEYAVRWPRAQEILTLTDAAAYSMIPFGIGGRPLGGWVVAYKNEHRPSSDERALIRTLGQLTGQALERLKLQQARIELAAALQRNMLPPPLDVIPGLQVAARYQPARHGLDIGGDWYDAFPLPDGTVALVIGDAEGHDVDAAAFMGQVRSAIRAFASHEPAPGTVLSRTNELLLAMGAPTFASCTILRFDPRDATVTGACAGHVPLLWTRADGSHGDFEIHGGPVLGVLHGAHYPDETFSLERDTTLLLVTDGVLEGPDRSLDDGLEMAAALAAQAQREGLDPERTADRVLGAAISIGHVDDAAVLVARRSPAAVS
ncbi:SpoIIE family protein phosphatase [Wenjunlia tyrosinilytica]|uniref:PPM-type phosphatase domain-containing protein n=1 Tax=Wenjunlia tyrosinilytica TaxID=1544741 RepID=A0A917ZLS2_9ACTN|nr:SpoIIE family protein phosphatase [Wenjunlia tyrosinilytica]GGO84372.1 hypothetical protein GCM10012280_15700 [Wenjunlia tyrosinilytica]